MDRRNFFTALGAVIVSPSILEKLDNPFKQGVIDVIQGPRIPKSFYDNIRPLSEATLMRIRQDNLNRYFNLLQKYPLI